MLNKGTVLTGRYEIIERIGTGGMADVYRAMDSKLNRFVAIKVLKREYREDEQFVTKFRQEARSVAGLSHPNVVGVYDVGSDGDIQYIVLELVEGISLKKYIEKKGHLPYKEALSIAIQVANGMEAAHAHHIVHRDIKPQNIIISKEGKVKVTDFGIAKAASSTTTVSTSAMGSVHYMSPEQARGGYSDERSDIYSFGITLFEMLTGDVPFDGDTTVAVAVHHIQDEIMPPSEKMNGIPSSVDKIVQKCTRKKTDQRYQTAGELIADLKRALQDPEGDFVTIPAAGAAGAAGSHSSRRENGRDDKGEGFEEDIDDISNERNPRLDSVLKWIGIGIAAALALVIVFFAVRYAQTGSIFGTPHTTESTEATVEQVRVPDVVGKTVQEATKTLEEAGFIVKSNATEGEIGSQDPAANSVVEKGTTVKIELVKPTTAEAKSKKLPNLVGLTEDDAISKINEMTEDGYELNYKINYEYNEAPFGNVIDMSPKADEEIKDGRTVNLTISRGEYTTETTTTTTVPPTTTSPTTGSSSTTTSNENVATVPKLIGMTESEAISALAEVGLSYSVRYSPYAEGTIGNVVYQQPYFGDVLEKGSVVTISIKSSPEESTEATAESTASSN